MIKTKFRCAIGVVPRAAALLSLVLLPGACSNHSSVDLRKQFERNKSNIVEILGMQEQDSNVVRIAPTFTRLKDDWSWPRKDIGISTERWDRYRALFASAGITDGVQNDGEYKWFFVASKGLSVGSENRGFVHASKVPSPIVTDFDECPKAKGICYIAIESNWYLFQWRT